MIHLRSVSLESSAKEFDSFPFDVPLIKEFDKITFKDPVTFFVGENGSGKSTLLEGIAAGISAIVVGGEDIQRDPTLEHARLLGSHLRFSWKNKTGRGFFLRAEDFFNFTRHINTMSRDLTEMAEEYDRTLEGHARDLAKGAVLGQRQALIDRYGEDAGARSHGEGFLHLFRERFVPGGLYLLDEPEAPLSPQRQLALLSMIKEMIDLDGQFIIATHSPIIMGYPDARILSFDDGLVSEVDYDDLEHVNIMKAFLNNRERFLRLL